MMFILIFLVDMIVAFFWAKGIKAVADKKALEAALWSGSITLASAFSVISYNNNHWLIIPALLGSALGTYFSVRQGKRP